eukprot:m.40008 g.40008  ORF g.40008 m.40008 type:complete len:61 (-) comp8034_c1_seq1:140-322(-)
MCWVLASQTGPMVVVDQAVDCIVTAALRVPHRHITVRYTLEDDWDGMEVGLYEKVVNLEL